MRPCGFAIKLVLGRPSSAVPVVDHSQRFTRANILLFSALQMLEHAPSELVVHQQHSLAGSVASQDSVAEALRESGTMPLTPSALVVQRRLENLARAVEVLQALVQVQRPLVHLASSIGEGAEGRRRRERVEDLWSCCWYGAVLRWGVVKAHLLVLLAAEVLPENHAAERVVFEPAVEADLPLSVVIRREELALLVAGLLAVDDEQCYKLRGPQRRVTQ